MEQSDQYLDVYHRGDEHSPLYSAFSDPAILFSQYKVVQALSLDGCADPKRFNGHAQRLLYASGRSGASCGHAKQSLRPNRICRATGGYAGVDRIASDLPGKGERAVDGAMAAE